MLKLSLGANRWSSESRVKLASTMPSRDRGGQNVKKEDDSQWVNDPLDDDVYCLDIEGSSRRRPSDDQVWLKIKDKTGVTNSTSFQQLDENKRNEMFLELKDCGASLRQLERLTGIGKGVIHRIWCAGR